MLDLLRKQLSEQEKTSAKQIEVLDLQVKELQESLYERRQDAAGRRRKQAAHVFLTAKRPPSTRKSQVIGADLAYITVKITNNSREPIYDAWLGWYDMNGDPTARSPANPPGRSCPTGKSPRPGASRKRPGPSIRRS
jgi:hypothetical protein